MPYTPKYKAGPVGQMDADKRQIGQLIEQQQLLLLYGAIPNSVFAVIFGCFATAVIFHGAISPYRLYGWIVFMLLVAAFRFRDYLQFRRAAPGVDERNTWYVRFRIGVLFQAFAVGSAGVLLFHYTDGNYQMLLALILVCICAFATTTLAPHRPIVVAFQLIGFVPMVIMVYFLETEVTRYISLILAFLIVMLIVSALRINKTVEEGIALSIEARYREDKLREYEQRMSMFVEETPLGVIEWDLEQHIRDWNPAAEQIFGYPEALVCGTRGELLFDAENVAALHAMWARVRDERQSVHGVLESRHKGGGLILCEWISTPLINTADELVGGMSLVQDVTQRIANERLKNEFVSIVSHELRTPVTSIKGGLGLLSSGVLDDDREKSREMLDIALSNTNRLQMLINDILDVDKLESGKMEYRFADADMVGLVSEVIKANAGFASEHQVQVRAGEMPPQCMVRMDPDRIFQVLSNLLSNAIKFSRGGRDVTVMVAQSDTHCRVAVRNFGEVIPESDREHMFTKFFQRDSSTTREKGGTGLGLYICQKILREHGSELDFSSSAEAGTTFHFELALA